ncbi:histidine phosphatase family protein [Streptomyces sp. SP17BM10]|uniref:SixA phosphatase family protein n=1 Tax=Streptomyces sp. SP17BM10 TaxID=3002530 RepID=UPI002E784103|nr:histidine phosphatase family protein [Streptomyces sp. SP17BM10]MEE1784468.1 histidine phosphatase family protein [Streptomyces sp. SP17BM10]
MSDTTTPPPHTLIVLRHAKSAWPAGVPDEERPLGPRGRRDAPEAGRWLRDRGLLPDMVVCSPARRARETWDLASAELPQAPSAAFDPRVYTADADDLVQVLRGRPRHAATVLLIGHNPALEDLVLDLAADTGGEALDRVREKYPTSGLAVLEVTGEWAALGSSPARLRDFAVPRGPRS